MSDLLDKRIVLKLNSLWMGLGFKTVAEAFTDLCGGIDGGTPPAMALDFEIMEDGSIRNPVPTKWEDWKKLPVRPTDLAILTSSGPIRVPLVVIAPAYDQMPVKRAKLTKNAIFKRDGAVCQYTGVKLPRERLNIDHIIPRSKGGKNSWENLIVSDKEINSLKGNKSNEEMGLHPIRTPRKPGAVPACATITDAPHPSHKPFQIT